MLAERWHVRHVRPVRHVRKTAIPTFFLFLVLISVNAPSVLADCNGCGALATQTDVIPAGGVEIPWGEDADMDVTLSANSVIPLFLSGYLQPTGYICGTLVAFEILTLPDIKAVKWQLKNPGGSLVYEKDVTGDWKGYSLHGFSVVCVPDPEIRVPAFADPGSWTLTLMVSKSVLWLWEHTYELGRFRFNVGESSMVDNIMAPIYLTWGGMPVVGWGTFSLALPCLFWITSPFWILAILFIMLVFYARSIKVAAALIKEGGKRFKLAVKGGGKT